MSERSIKPTVILPDTTPLVHLAAVDAPHLLNDLGRVVVVDVVALEATYFQNKPHAREIRMWIEAGKARGSNRPVEVAPTELGPLYKLASGQRLRMCSC